MKTQPLVLLNVVGLTPSLLGSHTPQINSAIAKGAIVSLAEPYPAVTCTSQACMLTGQDPSVHGIVGNGWYFRDLAEVGFWKQSNHLVQAPKIWDEVRQYHKDFRVSKLFWWYNMYSTANLSMTPRPHYPADGRKIFDIYTEPADLGKRVQTKIGTFPFFTFWGPNAGLACSKWITRAAIETYNEANADFTLIYLPHLDYPLQRLGPNHPDISAEVAKVDALVGQLLDFYDEKKVAVVIVSEYGISQVDTAIHPNRILRSAGYLRIRKTLHWELLDFGASPAFAVSDHQICHIYVNQKDAIPHIQKLFQNHSNIEKVIGPEERSQYGLNHERAGDIILLSKPNAWFTYYYWLEDALAPDFARCVDIHRKPGYDPAELFLDPNLKFPKLKMAYTLAKKIAGFRYYMDVIPLDAGLVKGSHGVPAQKDAERPLCIVPNEVLEHYMPSLPNKIPMTQVYQLLSHLFRASI